MSEPTKPVETTPDWIVLKPEAAVEYVKGLVVDFETKDGASGFSFGGTAPALDKTVALKARAAIEQSEKGPPIMPLGDFLKEQFSSNYGKVAGVLTLFTILELGAIKLPMSKVAIIVVLVILACWKAALVGLYFMHLKLEGRWKNVVLVPPVILAFVLCFALYPDVGAYARLPYVQVVPDSATESSIEHAQEKAAEHAAEKPGEKK